MCLLIDKNENVKIASTDIKVYKVLVVRNFQLVSPYYKNVYHLGEEETAIGGFDKSIETLNIAKVSSLRQVVPLDTGLHSYSSYYTAKAQCIFDDKIFLAIIPQGSRYLHGMYDEILSERLKIVAQLFDDNANS